MDKCGQVITSLKPPEYWVTFAGRKGRLIEVEAGTGSIWRFCFRCGSKKIKPGGKVRIFCEVPKFWLGVNLQDQDENKEWYCSVTGSKRIRIVQLQSNWKKLEWVTMELEEGAEPGDEFIFKCGTEKNLSYAIAHKYKNALVTIMVDYEGDGDFSKIWPPLTINIVPGKIRKLSIIAPSIVRCGESFVINFRGEDINSNIGAGKGRKVIFKAFNSGEEITLALDEEGIAKWKGALLNEPGIYRLEAVLLGDCRVFGVSNPINCCKGPAISYYWGDCHCHTGWADGIGSCEYNFDFAKEKAFLNVYSITEHLVADDCYRTPVVGKEGTDWAYLGQLIEEYTDKYNKRDEFCTILGYEYTPEGKYKEPTGDHCVFSPSRLWIDVPTARELPDLLALARESGALVIPHVGGRTPDMDKVLYCPETTPIIEIASMHGRFEAFAQKGLQKGYKLGFCGMSDGHYGCPGYDCWALHGRTKSLKQRNFSVQSALTVFITDELSREKILEAMRHRKTYATTGERIILRVDINGYVIGEEFKTCINPRIKAVINGTGPISRIDIIRGDRRVKMWEFSTVGKDVAIEWEDENPVKGETYYYLRIMQEDFAIAWSSPIWVDYAGSGGGSHEQVLSLPMWNAGPEWPCAGMGKEMSHEHVEAMTAILKKRGIYERFSDLEPVGLFKENRGKFSFFRGYDASNNSPIHAAHYFEFEDDRITIAAGWSPYGQVEY